jgi:hypothetical protein
VKGFDLHEASIKSQEKSRVIIPSTHRLCYNFPRAMPNWRSKRAPGIYTQRPAAALDSMLGRGATNARERDRGAASPQTLYSALELLSISTIHN